MVVVVALLSVGPILREDSFGKKNEPFFVLLVRFYSFNSSSNLNFFSSLPELKYGSENEMLRVFTDLIVFQEYLSLQQMEVHLSISMKAVPGKVQTFGFQILEILHVLQQVIR